MKKFEQIFDILSISATSLQIEKLMAYCENVLAHNPRANITGAKSVEGFIDGPLFDALTLLPVLLPQGTMVDVGSGGGLPAIPAAIFHPDMHFTLVEPRGKRAAFLEMMIQSLQLNAIVLQTQDRELTVSDFDGASAQAVFPPKKWLSRAKKLVRSGGAIYTLTSEEVTEGMLPNRVTIESQKRFSRDDAPRFAARLRMA